jgi:hypothetical protein
MQRIGRQHSQQDLHTVVIQQTTISTYQQPQSPRPGPLQQRSRNLVEETLEERLKKVLRVSQQQRHCQYISTPLSRLFGAAR